MPIKIDHDKCCWKDGRCSGCKCGGACKGCVEACPSGAISRNMIVEFDESKCTGCGMCVSACSRNAISLE